MPTVLVSGPAIEPVTLAELKLQLGLDPSEDADHVKSRQLAKTLRRYITTARIECENRTRRCFITQTWQTLLDRWPHQEQLTRHHHHNRRVILVPKPPFRSLLNFTYTDTAGNLQNIVEPVLATGAVQAGSTVPTNFTDPLWGCQIDPGSDNQPARLLPPYLLYWPFPRWMPNAIQYTFIAGYGDTGSAVPDPITTAILFLAHSYYDPSAFKDVDATVDSLLNVYVNRVS